MIDKLMVFTLKLIGRILTLTPFHWFFINIAAKYKWNEDNQPVFIIGAPRTGSTILYQALTNNYQVGYIDNLANCIYKCLPAGIWLSKQLFKNTAHENFRANHGDTAMYGLHAPSECGAFWYRWLPRNSHFIGTEDLANIAIDQIKLEITQCLGISKTPFLFKNLNAGQRPQVMYEMFPDAKIIYIKRDAHFTVNSLVNTRKEIKVKSGQWWSIKPKDYQQYLDLNDVEMSTVQVLLLEKQIEQDIILFKPQNVRCLEYNDLSHDTIHNLAKWLHIKDYAI